MLAGYGYSAYTWLPRMLAGAATCKPAGFGYPADACCVHVAGTTIATAANTAATEWATESRRTRAAAAMKSGTSPQYFYIFGLNVECETKRRLGGSLNWVCSGTPGGVVGIPLAREGGYSLVILEGKEGIPL